ncbi:putative mitochondrial hypothetical protein [Leptomonas pyrrhocoris]|uniref:Uncharacterized protein n=1 Tax=Leptomonas pyrrhocoris TaxID=157538 RepID=A0A0N0VG96_LEPPY|nr:putative mitochondrial hypothetical protein [Leptomonas pyrrhocoris]KPA82544.1 putative mitochondrial hypothetical protein [Leptomonas pyrrhocoris]|eukprot:XP_015660983.1 putative mitochondrial hypothetical protein [Leptomonas pyrrhocoris]
MATLKDRFAAAFFFSDPEDALAAEKARNEEARAKATETRLRHSQEERDFKDKVDQLDNKIKHQREHYARQAAPMLKEFDDIAISQHYYQEVGNNVSAQESFVDQMVQREVQQFGYMSKKLVSVGLNFEALRQKMRSGEPFAQELKSALDDAESEDLIVMSAPLQHFAERGVPKPTLVRAAAFDLARSIEETGKAPVQQPVRSWLDMLKFRTAFSPSTVDQNEVRARRAATQFTRYVEQNQYAAALSLAEEAAKWTRNEKDASFEYFDNSYQSFLQAAVPAITSEVFLAYASASLNASRYACVEHMLKEQ